MYNYWQVNFTKISIFIGIVCFNIFAVTSYAQDTLSGNYTSLNLKSGTYVIKETVTIKGKLTIQPGAKIELSDPGVLVCEGEVIIIGESKNLIEILGKSKYEGIGLVIRSVDSTIGSKVQISNTIFRNLQLPLSFDFGWHREYVSIYDNYFINNIGKLSLIQILNTPYNYNVDSTFVDFKINHNLFSGNNASIYFEDLNSDHVKFEISNNTFFGNNVYGFKNYNISTNFLHGRIDQSYTKFSPLILNNSFVSNFLIDNLTDTVVHMANFGVYGSGKSISLINNYFGSSNKEQILKSIYDQTIDYNMPKVEFEPYLNIPSNTNPSYIYDIRDLNDSIIPNTINITNPLKGFTLLANNYIDYSKSKLIHTYFKDDSSLIQIDSNLSFNIETDNLKTKFLISNITNTNNNLGYYTLSNILNKEGAYVPEFKIGYIEFLKDLRRRNLLAELIKEKISLDTLNKNPKSLDSIENTFQKIETSFKSRFEFGLFTGASVFTGTISNKGSLFSNLKNMLLGVNVNYLINSKLSAGLNIESFKLSNSDMKSNNNDQAARGMSFTTSMLSISPMILYDFIDNRLYTKAKKIKPSFGFGLDIVSFTPTGIYNGVSYNLQPLGTGGQFSDSTKKPYSLLTFGYFLTFKLKYHLNKANSVGINMSYHRSMSDYLDDVGPDSYPNVSLIMKSKIVNKDAAIYFSNPTSRNVLGQYRNSPDNAKDSYLNFSIFYSRKLFK